MLEFLKSGTKLRTASARSSHTGLSALPETAASIRMFGAGKPESRNNECISSPSSGRAPLPRNASVSHRAASSKAETAG